MGLYLCTMGIRSKGSASNCVYNQDIPLVLCDLSRSNTGDILSVNTRPGNPKVRTQDSGLSVTKSGPNPSD